MVARVPTTVRWVRVVPDWITDRITGAEHPLDEAIAIAIEQAIQLKDIAHGIHIMPLGSDDAVSRILEGAGLR